MTIPEVSWPRLRREPPGITKEKGRARSFQFTTHPLGYVSTTLFLFRIPPEDGFWANSRRIGRGIPAPIRAEGKPDRGRAPGAELFLHDDLVSSEILGCQAIAISGAKARSILAVFIWSASAITMASIGAMGIL